MNTKESSNAAWALLSIVCERARVFLMFATALFSFSSSLSVLYCCLSCTSNSSDPHGFTSSSSSKNDDDDGDDQLPAGPQWIVDQRCKGFYCVRPV